MTEPLGAIALLPPGRYAGSNVSTIPLVFSVAGCTDLKAPLTWGQRRVAGLQADLAPAHATLNIRFARGLRPGLTVADVMVALRGVLERCESLRTRFRTDAETAYQDVADRGVVEVLLVDSPSVDGPFAERVGDDLAAKPFSPTDLPFRAAIIMSSSVPRFVALAISHLAVDYFGAGWLLWHLRDVLHSEPGRGGRIPTAPAQPLQVSKWERSAAGREVGDRSVARHASTYTHMPASMLPRLPQVPMTPRYRYLELSSPSATSCLRHLSTRHGVTETAVLYGVLSLLLAEVSGLSRSHLQVCVSNRVDHHFGSVVAPLTQDVPTWVGVTDTNFDGLLRRSAGVLLRSATHGRFPPEQMSAEQASAERRRGVALDLSFWLNSRLETPLARTKQLSATELSALRSESTITEDGGDATSTSTLFVYADHIEGVLHLRILVDTAFVALDEARWWLSAVDDLLYIAAQEEAEEDLHALAAAAGIHPPERDNDWALVDHSWVHLPTTAGLLRRLPRASELRLELDWTPDGNRLVAKLDDGVLLVPQDMRDLLTGLKVAMLPHMVRHPI